MDSEKTGPGTTSPTIRVAVFLLAFMVPFALYLWTLAPSVTLEDSGELIVAARYLGVAHPPGYPLWCLLAHTFTRLPFGCIAERVHMCSATFAALTCLVVCMIVFRLTKSLFASLSAAWSLGFSAILWSQAIIAEVYSLNAFLTASCIYSVIRWHEKGTAGWAILFAFMFGLGCTNHFLIILLIPALAVPLILPHWRALLRMRVACVCAVVFLAALSIYAYLPIRAAADPVVNWNRPVSFRQVVRHVTRRDYHRADTGQGGAGDFARHCLKATTGTVNALTWPLAAFGAAGAVVLWRRKRYALLVSLAGIAVLDLFVLNLFQCDLATPRSIYVHRVYYIPAHMAVAVLAGICIAAILKRRQQRSRVVAAIVRGLVLLLVLMPLAKHYRQTDMSNYMLARNFGLDYMSGIPENAGILPVSDEVGFVCVYMKWIENFRTDVTIVSSFFKGYDSAVSACMSEVPATDNLVTVLNLPTGTVSRAFGLCYQLLANRPAADPIELVPLPSPPRYPSVTGRRPTPFESYVRGIYAVYHARLGAVRAEQGNNDGAEKEFLMSEQLGANDAYACHVLAGVYSELGINSNRVAQLRSRAQELYERDYDPAEFRFYPIEREDLVPSSRLPDRESPAIPPAAGQVPSKTENIRRQSAGSTVPGYLL